LQKLSRLVRALVSLAFSVLVILFFYGYLTPFGLDPNAILGPQFAALLGSNALMGGATGSTSSLIAPFIPGGAAGIIVYTILKRSGGVTRSLMAPSAPSPDEMMKRMNIEGMMSKMGGMGMMAGASSLPMNLPADITRSQFVVLRGYRQGLKGPMEVANSISMDKAEVDAETSALVANGYLTKDLRLSIKAMGLLGN
jgi:hypothetical protein